MTAPSTRTKRTRRRFLAAWAVVGMLSGLTYIGSSALAVHDADLFQIADGDPVVGNGSGPDWSTLYAGGSLNGTAPHLEAFTWVADGDALDGSDLTHSIFTGGGSKDPQPISAWAWKNGGGLPDKDNLLHAFAARFRDDSRPDCPGPAGESGGTTDCVVLYFGSDRHDNSGDAMQAFWFFQDEVDIDPDNPNDQLPGGTGFIGQHQNGDLLVISDFSIGGSTAEMRVYKWDDSCVRTNVPDGGCIEQNLRTIGFSAAPKGEWCPTIADADSYCGVVNSDTTAGTWDHYDKRLGSVPQYRPNTFFEGGINLSAMGLDNECFGSVMAETRSSTSVTATLKDFVIGDFQDCTSGLVTAPAFSDGTLIQVPAGGSVPTVSIGTEARVNVADRNSLTINGTATWSGTLTNVLCGPTSTGSTELCSPTAGNVIFETSREVSGGSGTTHFTSDWTTVTSAGRYCWFGEFTSAVQGLPGASDGTSGECFIVTPLTPTIETSAATSVLLGQPIYDIAKLRGTARQPDGSLATGEITFTVYGPEATSSASCGTLAWTSPPKSVTSGDGDYSSGTWTPVAPGYYFWIASYSGNPPNTEPTAGTCGATYETTYVERVAPTILTRQSFYPQDSATISVAHGGVGNITGMVTFELYVGSASCGAGYFVKDWTAGVDSASPVTVSTANTTVSVSDGTTAISWSVWFTSTNQAVASIPKSAATCREKTTLSISDGTAYTPTP